MPYQPPESLSEQATDIMNSRRSLCFKEQHFIGLETQMSGLPHQCIKTSKGGCQEDGARFFNRQKLMSRKFHLSMRKNFFTVLVPTHWNRMPSEAVESPSLEIHKKHLDAILG